MEYMIIHQALPSQPKVTVAGVRHGGRPTGIDGAGAADIRAPNAGPSVPASTSAHGIGWAPAGKSAGPPAAGSWKAMARGR